MLSLLCCATQSASFVGLRRRSTDVLMLVASCGIRNSASAYLQHLATALIQFVCPSREGRLSRLLACCPWFGCGIRGEVGERSHQEKTALAVRSVAEIGGVTCFPEDTDVSVEETRGCPAAHVET